MATDPDALIANSVDTANEMIDRASSAIDNIRSSIVYYSGLAIPLPDLSNYPFDTYTLPDPDTTPVPVYQSPTTTIPILERLADVPSISTPLFPVAPVLADTSSLFQQVAPTGNLPEWNVAHPNMKIDELEAEMTSIALPFLRTFEFPEISELLLSARPTITIPGYDNTVPPDELIDPVDYAAYMQEKYNRILPEMQSYVDDKVTTWIAIYCPEYSNQLTLLVQKIESGLNGSVLPDQIESAMITRARSRIDVDANTASQEIRERFKKNGFIEPPGRKQAALLTNTWKKNDNLSGQSLDIYIKRRDSEVQHLQFVMGIANTNIQSVRNLSLQYASIVVSNIQNAINYSKTISEMAIQLYEHLIARSTLAIAIMSELRQQYELRLKAALSELDSYRLELEAEKLKKDVEMINVNIIEAQIRANSLEITRYSAIIDAIDKKSEIEELKLKGYSTQAEVFDIQTKLKIAEFDVYKAALMGDESKLKGQMALIDLYNGQLNAVNTELEANIKTMDAVIAGNEAKVKVFNANADVYKLDIETALNNFTVSSEIKKLAQEIYKTTVDSTTSAFNATLSSQKLTIDTIMREYEGRLKKYELDINLQQEASRLNQASLTSIAGAYGNLAGSAIGAANTMVSSAA